MPYTFQLQSKSNSAYMSPVASQLNNIFIDWTIQGLDNSTASATKPETFFVTDVDISADAEQGYSKPAVIYNLNKQMFFGNTEQLKPLGSSNSTVNGTVVGAINVTCSALAPKFRFKKSLTGDYEIFLHEPAPALKADLRKLVFDKSPGALNRAFIVPRAAIIASSIISSDKWIVKIVG